MAEVNELAKKLDDDLQSFLNDKIEKGKSTGYEYVLEKTPDELANVCIIHTCINCFNNGLIVYRTVLTEMFYCKYLHLIFYVEARN